MHRFMKRSFQFEKERYLFTVDTDGLELFLRCYRGSSEKSEPIEAKRFSAIHDRILDIIRDEESSVVVRNLCAPTKKLSLEMREYYRIPYPENERFSMLEKKLDIEGSVEISGDDDQFLDYLEVKKIKHIKLTLDDKLKVFSSCESLEKLSNDIFQKVRNKKKEIQELEELIYQIDKGQFQLKR